MNKTQIISALVTVGAVLNTIYGFIQENNGVLTDLGLSPKWGVVIMLLGLIITSLSTSLGAKKQGFLSSSEEEDKGKVTPDKAP
jgi:hypothetical protein